MKSEVLRPEDEAALLRRQQALECEAAVVIEDLKLVKGLSRLGTPQQIGSSASGLMVWRDIDFHVVTPRLTVDDAWDAMRLFAVQPRIHRVRFMNESGKFNPTGELRDERYYFCLFYAPDQGEEWKIDVSFWLNDAPRSEWEDLQKIRMQLNPESRLAILWLKDVWHSLPTYRTQVFSMDIYDAVLKHDIRTPTEFDNYLTERGKPGRQNSV